jgi:hypothetical protein
MLYLLSIILLSLFLSTHQVQAAANFTSSSTGQNVKVLIDQAIVSLNKGNTKAALSNLTLADRLLGG